MKEEKKRVANSPISVAFIFGALYFSITLVRGSGNIAVLAIGCAASAVGVFILERATGRGSRGGLVAGAAVAVAGAAVVAALV